MEKTNLYTVTIIGTIKGTGKKFEHKELICGKCLNVLLGYDEDICPSCGTFVDMDDDRTISADELTKLVEKKAASLNV